MDIRKKIRILPHQTGCYIMKNADDVIIYVGKAKDLQKRVSSYWRARDIKTYQLVQEIADIEYILTNTEVESLILEAQLIQQHHPRYNIDLQTPGRYAFLKITNEKYPRIVIARRLEDKGIFIGPYPSASARNAALAAGHRIFQLCKQKAKKGRACFRYHLGACSGSCAGIIPVDEYCVSIKAAERFLRGDLQSVIADSEKNMKAAAAAQQYEKATVYRDRMIALRKLETQNVSRPKRYDQDVVNGLFGPNEIRIQIFHFNRGIISGRKEYTFDMAQIHRDDPAEVLSDFLLLFYRSHDVPREIVVPLLPADSRTLEKSLDMIAGHTVSITVPKKGIKKKLLDLVKKNLWASLGAQGGQLRELQIVLSLPALPVSIACVDISTLSGTNTVGSLVRFSNGQPQKTGYRRFKIKSVIGINDFAAIEELVGRFAQRVRDGGEQKPTLLVIDGGKGQLSSALKSLRAAGIDISVVALAKRLEEIYLPHAAYPLRLSPRSPALQLLRSIRDEAHRFAITYQRKRRSIKR